MALCTTLSLYSKRRSAQNNSYLSLYKIRYSYHPVLQNILYTSHINYMHLIKGLARSFSVGGVIPTSKTRTTYNRTRSLYVREPKTECPFEESISKDFSFTAVEDEDDGHRYYSTKTPYRRPSQEYMLSSPPSGYKPICVQLLARHGSRTLTNHDYDRQNLRIWQSAKEQNMLTPLGEQLKEDIEFFIGANNHIGRGELTQLGKYEHNRMGTRVFYRLKSLFIPSKTITVMTSGKKRAVDSAQAFLDGLTKFQQNIPITILNSNDKLLYFHKSCINYMSFKNNDPYVRNKIYLIKNLEESKRYARDVLKRIYTQEFVEFLIHGNYELPSDDTTEPTEDDTITNEVDIVLCLYYMFSVALALGQPRLTNMLAKYFNQEESHWFAYIQDAQEFYFKGPSIKGTTVTYAMANPLLADFFCSIDECIEEPKSSVVAHLRFAHAETVIPFATLLQIPGFSDEAVDPLDIYRYETNCWRGDKVASMATNIQWEIYQHEDNHSQVLVRMLYNETEVRFKHDCQPITPNSFFYDLNNLKQSYADHRSSEIY